MHVQALLAWATGKAGNGEREWEREREREVGSGNGKFASLLYIIIEVHVRLRNVLNGAVSPRFLKLLSMAHCASNIKNLF